MSYPYLTAAQSITNSPKTDYIELFQETLNEQFYNAADVFTIQEETALASGEYQNVDVRINYVINTNTGERISDDFKTLLFKNINHPIGLGKMYQFDNNYWVCVNVDRIKTLASTAQVRRCNNVLRWMDLAGGLYEVPCFLGYLIKENRDYATAGSAIVVPSGMIDCVVQFNSFTNKIRPNQRFLFGNANNWTAYRVEGGGINNFDNLQTLDNNSAGVIRFSLAVDYISTDTDDLVNGIANVLENEYELTLSQSSISGEPSQLVQLYATVTLNESTVTRSLVWSSSNTQIATVSSTGLVTFVSEGVAEITCHVLNNEAVSDSCDVIITSTPVDTYQLVISPNTNFVYEDNEVTWTVYLYKNTVQQADVISFTLNPNTVPDEKYIYEVLGANSFKVHNYGRFLTDVLEVTCETGIYSKVINISLRGAF